jgi:cytochrome c553
MTRPVPIAASLALAALSFAAFAQTQTAPATSEPAPAAAAPAPAAPAPAAAAAAASTPATPVGSAARGKLLTFTCQGCHGVTGYKNAYPNYHVPRIGGQSAAYLANALAEYRKGARKHPTMQAQAQSFSGQDIADIAAYLSELKQ